MSAVLEHVIIVTINDARIWAERTLAESKFESPSAEVQALLSGLLQCSYSDIYLHRDRIMPNGLIERFKALIAHRQRRVPVAYLLKSQNFHGRDFFVDRRVLIPRPETEILVDVALDEIRAKTIHAPRILDVGTGSGCVAVTLACELPEANVVGVDLSAGALDVAQSNAKRFNASNTQFFQSDVYSGLPAVYRNDFDIIVSNPPYVSSQEMTTLEPELHFEPNSALEAGRNGLSVIEPLILRAKDMLKDNGILIVEIGFQQGLAVKSLFELAGFNQVTVLKDFQRHDRFVKGELRGSI